MSIKLHYNVVSPLLLSVLKSCMTEKLFEKFILVGGTALSLQRGHRKSLDIDLFTDTEYETVDFDAIDNWLKTNFPYFDSNNLKPVGIGKSYFIGNNKSDCIKLDLYYTDKFIFKPIEVDGIRLATVEEILSMKADVIMRGGRKKDFWDLHNLLEDYSLDKIISLHKKRYPYSHDKQLLLTKLVDFSSADNDFEPICLQGKHWELIKFDIVQTVNAYNAD